MSQTIIIRRATQADDAVLRRLAALDSRPAPQAPMLLAEVDGTVWASLALDGSGEAIADPFRPSTAAVSLLRARAAQLTARPGRRRRALRLSAAAG